VLISFGGRDPFARAASKKRRNELGSRPIRAICSRFAFVGPPPWLPTP
jgi:hypothetical protein